MNINELIRMMESHANSSDMGITDFVFASDFTIRHTASKINDDRLLVISVYKKDEWSTAGTIIYEKELLNEECKFIGMDMLLEINIDDLTHSYAYSAMTYCDLVKEIIISSICSSEVYEAYLCHDAQILNAIKSGNIDFPLPTILEDGNIITNDKLHDDHIIEQGTDLNRICDMILDYLADLNTIKEIKLRAETLLATNDITFWQELKITKSFIFGELHLVFGRIHCATPKKYLNGYIVKLSEPDGLADYINGAMSDIIKSCVIVSSNPVIYKLDICRVSEFKN